MLPPIAYDMHSLVAELFPICRSITGNGVRQTFEILQRYLPLSVVEVPSGEKVFDWEIPNEWNVQDAYVIDPNGKKIIDFKKNNLHLMGYSTPINQTMSLEELQPHLHSLSEQPDAIPYKTSYYHPTWGFCISDTQRQTLQDGQYQVVIDTTLTKGSLTYGEIIIPGELEQEIFISTYICHPSMANNELSGPVVATYLTQWILSLPRRFTYRIIFIPETIGALAYLSKHLDKLKKTMIAGFVLTCIGDNRSYSYLPSRHGRTLADKVIQNVLGLYHPTYKTYSFAFDRGSDERQYCSPGIDLPVASLMRSKYDEYPEYHTSLDNLDLVTPEGLYGGYEVIKNCVATLELNHTYTTTCLGEPQLGKRGLYPKISTKDTWLTVRNMMNLLAYSDGTMDLIDISTLIKVPVPELAPMVNSLIEGGVLAAS